MGELEEEDDERGKEKRAVQAVHYGGCWRADAPRREFLECMLMCSMCRDFS